MKQITATEYLITAGIGFLVGLRLLGASLGLFYMAAGGACIYFAFRNDHFRLFTVLPYVVFTEVFIRNGAGVTYVPYLFVEYLLIGVFVIMLLSKGGSLKLHSRCALPIFLYAIVEILDMIRAHDITYARSMVTNTIVLTAMAMWASANTLSPRLTAHIIKHLALAAVYLSGNILVAHFTHEITYMLVSSSESTNRMAPVQISGYLGIGSSMIFLYIMNEKYKQAFIVHLFAFTVIVTLMVLTFSRGGIYFLAGVIALYALFNRKEVGRFAILLFLVPIGYIIYYYAMNATDGKLEQRYVEKGDSGRTELVEAGFTLFLDEPLAGVGTGNYGSEILNRNLYGVESGAHNEFVRAAAEHGILGIIFYWGFYAILIFEFMQRKKQQRDMAFYLLLLFSLIIVHNGLKIAAQPYILTIAIATPTLIRRTKKKQIEFKQYIPAPTA
ncbi:O-antigen ligase family protein [Panacibacter ginsenosidivorans]|uniref:O-antigen ligase family protein n=1 Tax=Panacibacter ginsenosidivorans TaxID=1813871 RepID=A0A5B8VFH3_9BACT|nr:O-antigen ligase family protein [Panacibacter ginsenosidivorans]QEC69098.1 O-antigen ligase family protein [Panacibacter ginsenosidivorans]